MLDSFVSLDSLLERSSVAFAVHCDYVKVTIKSTPAITPSDAPRIFGVLVCFRDDEVPRLELIPTMIVVPDGEVARAVGAREPTDAPEVADDDNPEDDEGLEATSEVLNGRVPFGEEFGNKLLVDGRGSGVSVSVILNMDVHCTALFLVTTF